MTLRSKTMAATVAVVLTAAVFGCKKPAVDELLKNPLLTAFTSTAKCAWSSSDGKLKTVDHSPDLKLKSAAAIANMTGKPVAVPAEDPDGYLFMGGQTVSDSVRVKIEPKPDGQFTVTYEYLLGPKPTLSSVDVGECKSR